MNSNAFGIVYPNYDHAALADALGITAGEKVLDIGGGHNPFARADYIIDCDLLEGDHRGGNAIPDEHRHKYLQADVHALPFADKSIDVIYCSHVLEHVKDPAKACAEIIRVGKRGFIETPRKWTELVAGYPSHQWLIDLIDGTLVFERKQFIESPYLNVLIHNVWKNSRLRDNAIRKYLNLSCVQLHWSDSFSFRVVDDAEGSFNYDDPVQASWSHYYFARNIFALEAPLDYGIFHARRAAALIPDQPEFRLLLASYALAMGDETTWKALRDEVIHSGVISGKDLLFMRLGRADRAVASLRSHFDEHGTAE